MRRRPRFGVPMLSPTLSSHWIGLVTPVDTGVARPLVEGLTTETVVEDDSGMALFDVEPTPLREAMTRGRRPRATLRGVGRRAPVLADDLGAEPRVGARGSSSNPARRRSAGRGRAARWSRGPAPGSRRRGRSGCTPRLGPARCRGRARTARPGAAAAARSRRRRACRASSRRAGRSSSAIQPAARSRRSAAWSAKSDDPATSASKPGAPAVLAVEELAVALDDPAEVAAARRAEDDRGSGGRRARTPRIGPSRRPGRLAVAGIGSSRLPTCSAERRRASAGAAAPRR